jgi:hypothetical protein
MRVALQLQVCAPVLEGVHAPGATLARQIMLALIKSGLRMSGATVTSPEQTHERPSQS